MAHREPDAARPAGVKGVWGCARDGAGGFRDRLVMRRPSHGMRTLAITVVLAACGNDPPPGDDAPPDAPPVADDCPNRTAPTGMPAMDPGMFVLGDATIRTALDVQGLAGFKVITGDP